MASEWEWRQSSHSTIIQNEFSCPRSPGSSRLEPSTADIDRQQPKWASQASRAASYMEQGIKSGASVEAVGKALDLLLNHVEGCLQICPYLLTFPPVGVLQLYMGHKTQIHSAHCAPIRDEAHAGLRVWCLRHVPSATYSVSCNVSNQQVRCWAIWHACLASQHSSNCPEQHEQILKKIQTAILHQRENFKYFRKIGKKGNSDALTKYESNSKRPRRKRCR